jgi:heterodisulfide reductase subunit B
MQLLFTSNIELVVSAIGCYELKDYPNNDISQSESANTILECQHKCQDHESCIGFTVVFQNNDLVCWLKSKMTNGQTRDTNQFISAPKFCPGSYFTPNVKKCSSPKWHKLYALEYLSALFTNFNT